MGLFSRKGTTKGGIGSAPRTGSAAVPSLRSGKSASSTITNGNTANGHGANGAASASLGSLSLTSALSVPSPPDPNIDPAGYLRSLQAVRERAAVVHARARRNALAHFHVDLARFADTAAYVVAIIRRDHAPDFARIPAHGRWQHFEAGGRPRVDQLMATWPLAVDAQERTRRLLDLFLVSVLLDAGAGARWSYRSRESGRSYRRSEGLAVASLEMFKAGAFSSNPANASQVDAKALRGITVETLAKGLQVTEANPLNGLEGRAGLLNKLGDALGNREYFGKDARPGNMLDFLISHPLTQASSVPIIPITTLWEVLMDGLAPIWPSSRTRLSGVSLGDAWPCPSLPSDPGLHKPWEGIAPFHKLTQWLAYSLMAPMARLLHVRFAGAELLTGLPEYRNGGLLIDTGLLTLREGDRARGLAAHRSHAAREGRALMEVVPLFAAGDPVVVEWRAATVGFLDALLDEVNRQLGLAGGPDALSLAQMLEAGTWKGGREIAEVSRPNTKEPPIMIISDGTVF